MRIILAVLLSTMLAIPQVSAQTTQDSVKQEVAAIPSKALVDISMRAGGILRGHIVSRADADFTLRQEKGGTTQTIAYDQVLSISQVKTGHSHKKWIIIGVVIVGAVVIVGLALRSSCGHLCGA